MNRITIILIIGTMHFCLAQNFETRLQSAYNNFDNPLVDSLLADAGQHYDKLPDWEKTVFHKFKAFRASQMDEQQIVQKHFRDLIAIDPVYTLDPLTTSPKLLTLFTKTKLEYLEQQQLRIKKLSEQNEFAHTPWRSLVFPGWEQWHRGAKTKAWGWAALGTITLAGAIQAVVRTQMRHDEYLEEKNPALVAGKYDDYNDVYKSQYYWAYGLTLVWISSHIDAVFFTENKNIQIVIENPAPGITGIMLKINL